jgi:hypothetical protein
MWENVKFWLTYEIVHVGVGIIFIVVCVAITVIAAIVSSVINNWRRK